MKQFEKIEGIEEDSNGFDDEWSKHCKEDFLQMFLLTSIFK